MTAATQVLRRPWRLSARARKFTLLTHIVSAVAWIGVDLTLLVLAIVGLTSDDPNTVTACYVSMNLFGIVLLVPLALIALATGVLLGLGSKWGVLRYSWVLVKLAITVVLTTLVLMLLRPGLSDAAAASKDPASPLRGAFDQLQLNLLFPPSVSIAALSFVAALSVYKPWGLSWFGRRHAAAEQARVNIGRIAADLWRQRRIPPAN